MSLAFTLLGALVSGGCLNGCAEATRPPDTERPRTVASAGLASCPTGPAVGVKGKRQLALLVGVGDYASKKVRDLEGPPNDVQAMKALLTDPNGYAFPEANVCVLTGAQATKAAVLDAWENALVQRAGKDDSVVFFFAGHGSQSKDLNGDEPDEMDETLMFYDARTPSRGEILDDELNGLLAKLYRKTKNVTVILDACNAGTASRDVSEDVRSRFMDPPDEPLPGPEAGDGGQGWNPETMPNLVVLSGARDGTTALEKEGRGVFTQALVKTLGEASGAITYAQIARKIPLRMASLSDQVPEFSGPLTRLVLDTSAPRRPFGWEVKEAKGQVLDLVGVPSPGMSVGALLRIYPGNVDAATMKDPKKRIAVAEVESYDGFVATARVQSKSRAPEAGDVAALHLPGRDAVTINVILVTGRSPGALKPATARALEEAIASDPQASKVIRLGKKSQAFRVQRDLAKKLEVLGPEGSVRNTLEKEKEIDKAVHNLVLHARQKALLNLEPQGGGTLEVNSTLSVRLVRSTGQLSCVRDTWPDPEPNAEQAVPVCGSWKVRVKLDPNAPTRLYVGGLIFAADGSMYGLPYRIKAQQLEPGDTYTFPSVWTSTPPFDVIQRIRIFGTRERIPWGAMTSVATRFVPDGGLAATLASYIEGSRNTVPAAAEDPGPWTVSELTYRSEANPGFGAPEAENLSELAREYTIANFELAPYLPGDKEAPMYKVLRKIEWLTKYHHERDDGLPYKQHAWDKQSDEANLAVGIDCSRSQWFVFTRAGLPYTDARWAQGYMTTKMMAERSPDAPMTKHFDDCMGEKPRMGDLIVQRDATRGDGHVVMVIDPDQRIAWGSHGWDGNKQTKDTGVEFQKIRYKQDWSKWDRATMKRVACWRHKAFASSWDSAASRPGSGSFDKFCSAPRCVAP